MNWDLISNIASIVFHIFYYGIVLGIIIVIILDNRNPVKTLTWILILILLPIVGIFFYFFFGRSTRHERIISKKKFNTLTEMPMEEFQQQEAFQLTADQYKVAQLFQNINRAMPFEGNDIDILTDGSSMLVRLIKELYKAQKQIHIQSYIIENDPVGRIIKDILINKAHEGVKVRLIYDDVGCWHVRNSFFEEMKAEGIEVHGFLRVRFQLFTSKVNYRNHRKIVVIDGKCGFIGGMNLAFRYVKGINGGIWRDTHLCIKGKGVYGLQTSFLLDWYFADQTSPVNAEFFPKMKNMGSSLVQIVTSEPISPWKEIMQGLCLAITCAKKYFYIQTPYFLPTESILQALQTAALSGVDIRIMLPRKADVLITQLGTLSYIEETLHAGIKIYFYKKGFLHSKMMVSDDMLSTVGSTNMDFRSFEHNFEANAFMYDAPTALRIKEIFLRDQHDCKQVFLKNWVKRPLKQKIGESIVRLFAPLL